MRKLLASPFFSLGSPLIPTETIRTRISSLLRLWRILGGSLKRVPRLKRDLRSTLLSLSPGIEPARLAITRHTSPAGNASSMECARRECQRDGLDLPPHRTPNPFVNAGLPGLIYCYCYIMRRVT
jgi:hypothetical protein